jgi:RNA polymerase sigma-70 factor (ECF subfamily)
MLVEEFLRNRELIFGFILALTRNRTVAEDVFQEVGVAILDEAGKGTQPRNFLAWAREIARHRVSAYYRKHCRLEFSESMAEVVSQAFDENPIEPAENTLRQDLLQECMKRLPPKSREVIDCRYGQELSVEAIADRMSWTAASVKVALSRARKALTDCVNSKIKNV